MILTYFVLILFLILAVVYYAKKKPTHDRDWRADQTHLPYAVFKDRSVAIHNIRYCLYKSKTDYEVAYYDRTLNLDDLIGVDFIHQPFKKYILAGHMFFSFKFKDGYHLAVSIEARRKRGEEYSWIKGFFKAYHLIYILADERDILKLRSLHHGDDVYVYPTKITINEANKLLADILRRVNQLEKKPEFYHTITNNCATNLVKHLNAALGLNIGYPLEIIFSKHAEKFFHKLELFTPSGNIKNYKKNFRINERVRQHQNNDTDFSRMIRHKEDG